MELNLLAMFPVLVDKSIKFSYILLVTYYFIVLKPVAVITFENKIIAIKPKSEGANSLAKIMALIKFKPLAHIPAAVTQITPLLTLCDNDRLIPGDKSALIYSDIYVICTGINLFSNKIPV
jgi:hypothetical protein